MIAEETIANELKKLCETNSVAVDLVSELLKAEKKNLGNRGSSHKSLIESLVKQHIN